MKRRFLAPLLGGLAVLLTACPQPTPEPPPPPLGLAWQNALVTPDQMLTLDAAAGGGFVYVFNEELPLDGDYGKKWAALWRVDAASGAALGPVKFPDDAAAAALATEGFGCPQPLAPAVTLDKAGIIYVSAHFRNTAAQADGCDTSDGSWTGSNWAAFGVYDTDLNRTGLAWLKAFDGDDPTYSKVVNQIAGEVNRASVRGNYAPDSRGGSSYPFSGTLDAQANLNAGVDRSGTSPFTQYLFEMPDGGLLESQSGDPNGVFAERLVRYDAAGNELWSAVTTSAGFPPTERAAGVPGQPETVFVSGVARGGEPFMGQAPPAVEPDKAPFVARIDGGALSWIRWVHAEETEWFTPNHYATVPLVYDPEKDELYLGIHNVLLALDPADGTTRWITNLPEIIDGDRVGLSDWFLTYQPQNFTHLFLVDGTLVGVNYSWWDSNQGQGSETDRYRPLVLGFERRY